MVFSSLFRKKTVQDILRQVAKNESDGHEALGKHLTARDLTAFGIAAIVGAGIFSTIGKASADGGPSFDRFENPSTKELATPEMLAEWSADGAAEADIEAKAKEAGFVKADQDARVLMGQEKISVFVVIDITRFLGPDEVEKPEPRTEAKKGAKR